jgi:hypothetical protein
LGILIYVTIEIRHSDKKSNHLTTQSSEFGPAPIPNFKGAYLPRLDGGVELLRKAISGYKGIDDWIINFPNVEIVDLRNNIKRMLTDACGLDSKSMVYSKDINVDVIMIAIQRLVLCHINF